MMSSPYCAVSVLDVCEPHTMNANRSYSLRTTYIIFEAHLNSFPTVSLSFAAMKVFHQVISERMKNKASHR